MELGMAALLATAATFRLVIHRGFRVPRRPETGSPADLGLPFDTVSIPTERGRRLFAWYIPPSGPSGPMPFPVASSHVVVMHGWGANAEDMLPVAEPLHRAGYGVLLVDARNHGRSDRDSFSSMPRFAEDLVHAFDWLKSQPQVAPDRIALLGHSVGAIAAALPPGCGTLVILPEVGHDTVDRLDAVMTPVLAFLGAHLPTTPSA
jgi:dipeptidyl aminopeptidase/acylaminoacyl peptidase